MLKRLFFTKNVAWWDRILRLLPAVVALWAYASNYLTGPLAVTFAGISAMLLVTSLTGTCSIYGLFGLSTLRRKP